MKIIVVEDEPRALRGIKSIISSAGDEFQVVADAMDGKRALELITKIQPDVVFTDIKIPYINGIELIEALEKYNLNICYVIVSAYEEFSFAKRAMSLGVKEYLVKPLTYEEVEDVLLRLKKELEGKGRIKLESEDIAKRYPNAHPFVKKAIEMVEEGYGSTLSQKVIAERLGMTQEYFSYLFHKETGIKFTDFIRNRRIEIARQLLERTDEPVQDIAYMVGYSDEKYFSKTFKKVTGKTPTECRKQVE